MIKCPCRWWQWWRWWWERRSTEHTLRAQHSFKCFHLNNLLIYFALSTTPWGRVYYRWLHHLLVVWCWASYFIPQSLGFPAHKVGIKVAFYCDILSQWLVKCSRDKSDSHSSSFDPPVNPVQEEVLLWPWMVGRFFQRGMAELGFKARHGLSVLLACRSCFCCLCRAVSDPRGP